ncbi:MAG: amidohydrolase family protein [Gemmatimonas sp.]|nr:amidohydrolase family protein [Gemmatimonas sp.]
MGRGETVMAPMMETAVGKGSGRPPRIDLHVHLAGVGTQDSGCWISAAFRRRPTFLGLRALHRITSHQMRTTVDQDWVARLSALTGASELDFAVVLGFDGVYDESGQVDWSRSQMIVPPEWVFEACRRYSNLLPGPSINPFRRDAVDAFDAAIEGGAVLIKWLPIVQGFDPASPRIRPIYRRLADSGIPILVHAGTGEVTFRTVDSRVGGLDRLLPALELGVRVIVAHGAAPIHFSREKSQVPTLRAMLGRYPNLWVDNSALASPSRFRHLPRFVADPLIRERSLHGSDFPVVADSFYYPGRLSIPEIIRIQRERNGLQREVLIKRAIGFPDAALYRAASVLSNLDRWAPVAHSRR